MNKILGLVTLKKKKKKNKIFKLCDFWGSDPWCCMQMVVFSIVQMSNSRAVGWIEPLI